MLSRFGRNRWNSGDLIGSVKRSHSGRRENVNGPARNHRPGPCAKSLHMRCDGMGFERIDACPFFDDDESIWSELRLDFAQALDIDCRAIFDTALLGAHSRNILAKRLKHRFALPRPCRDDCEDMDHERPPLLKAVFAYGLDDRSGLPVPRSTGTETCSWTINQLPLILR